MANPLPFPDKPTPVSFSRGGKLQTLLKPLESNAAFAGMGIALADLSTSVTAPAYAGLRDTQQMYGASLVKIGAMVAAHRLKHNVEEARKSIGAKDRPELWRKLSDPWRPLVETKIPGGRKDFPQFSKIFDGGSGEIKFNENFNDHLTQMIIKSDNSSAGECIQRIGFQYINGALQAEGLFDKVGIWLGGDYVTGDEAKQKGYEDFRPTPLDKDVNKSVHQGDSTSQGATAETVAKLMTLVASGQLVSADASKAMQELMEKQKLESDFKTGLTEPPRSYTIRIYGKVGVGLKVGDDCAVIERTADMGGGVMKRVKYVAVGLREPVPYNLKKLIVALDNAIVQNNK